jgi:hypothetical protein
LSWDLVRDTLFSCIVDRRVLCKNIRVGIFIYVRYYSDKKVVSFVTARLIANTARNDILLCIYVSIYEQAMRI